MIFFPSFGKLNNFALPCTIIYIYLFFFPLLLQLMRKKRATSSAQEHVNFDERNMPIFGVSLTSLCTSIKLSITKSTFYDLG